MPTYECFVQEHHRQHHYPPVLASSLPEAIAQFRSQGIEVLTVRQRSQPALRRVAERELTLFYRNLAEALRSSLPLTEALQLVGQSSKHAPIQNACREMIADLRNGAKLSETAARHGRLFAETHVRLIEAGERSGNLPEALAGLADYRDEISHIALDLLAAFTYPLVLVLVGLHIQCFLCFFIVPKFMEIFRDFRVEMPALTVMVMSVQSIGLPVAFLTLGALTVAFFIVRLALWIHPARLALDQWTFGIPVVGRIFWSAGMTRLLAMMAMLARTRLPMPELIAIAARASGNAAVESKLLFAAEQARSGARLSEALSEADVFPASVIWRLGVAEKTGNVPEALQSLAQMFRDDVAQMTLRRVRIFEPFLVIVIGLMVGAVVVSMFWPLLSIITNLTQE